MAGSSVTIASMSHDAAPDPRPSPPEKPLPADCCDGGCDRCVFDIYAEELERYEQQLAAWRARQA